MAAFIVQNACTSSIDLCGLSAELAWLDSHQISPLLPPSLISAFYLLFHHFPHLFTLFSKNQIFMPSKIFCVFLCKFTFSFFPFGFLEFYFLSFMVYLGWAVETCLSTGNTPTTQVHTDPHICLSNHHGPCLSIL